MKKRLLGILMTALLAVSSLAAAQESVHIAVASNFLATLKALSKDFTAQTGIKVDISNGASGMLYAQIQKGAPYDMYFSADAERPAMLEKEGLTEPGSRFTYVEGRLVVWSPDAAKVSPNLADLKVENPNLHFIAIANPKTAPYGKAAVEVLKRYGLYDALAAKGKISIGENIGKTFHYVATQNAQLGLIAKSYVVDAAKPVKGEYVEIPTSLYAPLVQEAVILKGKKTPAVDAFVKFYNSDEARKRIALFGYGLAQ